MLDHALGRPSAGLKRIQVLLFGLLALGVLQRSPSQRSNLRVFQWMDRQFGTLPPWKIIFGTLSISWFLNNVLLALGMNAPEPLARMYTRNFYRASYILTSLDAGFFSAMWIKPIWLRDFLSFLFSVCYLAFPESADEKVRRFRAHPTIEMMRVSWNKPLNPYIRLLGAMDRPRLSIQRDILIPRPTPPSITSFPHLTLGPIPARLYFKGSEAELRKAKEMVLILPGGGFVAMGPKCHEDYVTHWANITRIPIVSLDYGKAPEFPYPFALEECFDAYRSIVESCGSVLGINGGFETAGERKKRDPLKIVMVGDSAGGNLVVGVVMRCLETYEKHIPPPNGVVLIYPCLSFDMSCWMPSEQLKLMRAESTINLSLKPLSESKHSFQAQSPLTPQEAPRKINIAKDEVDRSKSWYYNFRKPATAVGPSIPSALSMTSRMSYFTDRIITPEMMRAMALLYLGTSPLPIDLAMDYYLSPVIAPDDLLARFPKTYLLCGEKDPLVDDTVVFAGRLRENKQKAHKEWQRMMARLEKDKSNSMPNGSTTTENVKTHIFSRDPDSMVRVKILEGVSHGLFQMLSILPEAKQATRMTADWFKELLRDPLVDDHGDDLTEYMMRDLHAHEGERECGPQVGPYYPSRGVPLQAPSPHILVDDNPFEGGTNRQHHPLTNVVRFRDDGRPDDLVNHAYVREPSPDSDDDLKSPRISTTTHRRRLSDDLLTPLSSSRHDSIDSCTSLSDLLSAEHCGPAFDEVDEKILLHRRRTEIENLLYSADS